MSISIEPEPTADAVTSKRRRLRPTEVQRPTLIFQRAPSPDFRHLLRALRRNAGLSQREAAERLGESLSSYENIEAGRRWPWSDPDQMDRLSRILGLSAPIRDQLFRAAGLVPPELMPVLSQLDLIAICRRGADAVFRGSRQTPTHEKKYRVWRSSDTGPCPTES
jgi:transcriptional regulator with XRE-family HTH domain